MMRFNGLKGIARRKETGSSGAGAPAAAFGKTHSRILPQRGICMRLAFRELKYNWKKYLLIESIVVLMMFMVLFLSGLVNGLGRAVSAGVENMPADTFVMSEDSEKLLTVSSLTAREADAVRAEAGDRATPIDVQRMYLQTDAGSDKLDVTYFAIDPNGFLNPEVTEGEKLTAEENAIVLDDAFKTDGIRVGDTVLDSASGLTLRVVGFTEDAMYGHTAVGYLSTKTYRRIMNQVNPQFGDTVHAEALQGDLDVPAAGTVSYTKAEVIQAIPGYQAEQMTITMVQWLLLVITAFVIGIFFFVINLQKEKEFGVLKAIGTGMGRLVKMIVSQVVLIAAGGALIAVLLVVLMRAGLPASMPFYLVGNQVVLVLAAFVGISVLGSLATVNRVSRIDPASIIGGEFS